MTLRRLNTKTTFKSDDGLVHEGAEVKERSQLGEEEPAVQGLPLVPKAVGDDDQKKVNEDKSNDGQTLELAVQESRRRELCGICRQMTSDFTSNTGTSGFRCKPCNTLKSRMQRVFTKNANLRDQWNELGREARSEWLNDAAERLEVPDLYKALELYMIKSRETSNEVISGMKKWYGDSPDLSRRYKGKEEQLQHVKARAPKVWHEHRRMWLYEDFESTGSASTAEKDVSVERLRVQSPIKAKPKPKDGSKRTALAAALPDDAVRQKKLKPCETRILKALLKPCEKRILKALKAKIENARADTHRVSANDINYNYNVPADIRDKLSRVDSELDCMDDDVELTMNGEDLEFAFANFKTTVNDILKRHTIALKAFINVSKAIANADIAGS